MTEEYDLATLLEGFCVDRKARNVTKRVVELYHYTLHKFILWNTARSITTMDGITPSLLREYLLYLEETGHNPGGIHLYYRNIRAFLRWYADEFDRPDFQPLKKVKAPKVPQEPLIPISTEDIYSLLAACKGDSFNCSRDKAILLFLLDTGIRANELVQTNREDLNAIIGDVLIRQGKGRKPRTVFLGQKARRAVRFYLNHRDDIFPALFITDEGERLRYNGLRSVIVRRAKIAGIKPPALHSFRRTFALQMLRNGVDLVSLSRLMGHTDIQILKRYLAQSAEDLRVAHAKASPVDRLF